ncbi:hypothetical protein Lal_00038684 [Lupinus albus]|nr:hypothetical protein Lal_00038684 [Lupinus albus]
MDGHSESSSSEKKSSNGLNEFLTLNVENMQSNMKIIYYSRTFLSIIGGVVAGILGFTGLKGFVFYFLLMAVTSIGLVAKAKFSIHTYFDSWNRVLLDGFLSGLMSFVLFWTYPSLVKYSLEYNCKLNLFQFNTMKSAVLASVAAIDAWLDRSSYTLESLDSFHHVIPIFKLCNLFFQ